MSLPNEILFYIIVDECDEVSRFAMRGLQSDLRMARRLDIHESTAARGKLSIEMNCLSEIIDLVSLNFKIMNDDQKTQIEELLCEPVKALKSTARTNHWTKV